MPELPDVEVFRRYLDRHALHEEIEGFSADLEGVREHVSASTLRRRLSGHELAETRRYGKYLFVRGLGDGWLALHFGMTGELDYGVGDEGDHARLVLRFCNGHRLVYRSIRKLGSVEVTEDPDAYVRGKGLGPDALDPDFDVDAFRARIREHHGAIKSTLMNQEVMAGLGNVYTDEVLFRAKVHPATKVDDLDDATLGEIHRAILGVCETAIRHRADPAELPRGWLLPERREGGRCPACDTPLEHIEVAGRSTWLCPACQ